MTFNKCLKCGKVIKKGWEYRTGKCKDGKDHDWKIKIESEVSYAL